MIAEALRRGTSYETIYDITKIDIWFLDKFAQIVEMEEALKNTLTVELLKEAKRMEFPDTVIAKLTGKTADEVKAMRKENNIVAAFKVVDTCAGEFAAETSYYYSCFDGINEVDGTSDRKKVLVLGSADPYRSGH